MFSCCAAQNERNLSPRGSRRRRPALVNQSRSFAAPEPDRAESILPAAQARRDSVAITDARADYVVRPLATRSSDVNDCKTKINEPITNVKDLMSHIVLMRQELNEAERANCVDQLERFYKAIYTNIHGLGMVKHNQSCITGDSAYMTSTWITEINNLRDHLRRELNDNLPKGRSAGFKTEYNQYVESVVNFFLGDRLQAPDEQLMLEQPLNELIDQTLQLKHSCQGEESILTCLSGLGKQASSTESVDTVAKLISQLSSLLKSKSSHKQFNTLFLEFFTPLVPQDLVPQEQALEAFFAAETRNFKLLENMVTTICAFEKSKDTPSYTLLTPILMNTAYLVAGNSNREIDATLQTLLSTILDCAREDSQKNIMIHTAMTWIEEKISEDSHSTDLDRNTLDHLDERFMLSEDDRETYKCPLSFRLMRTPINAHQGVMYEKLAFQHYREERKKVDQPVTDPQSRKPYTEDELNLVEGSINRIARKNLYGLLGISVD